MSVVVKKKTKDTWKAIKTLRLGTDKEKKA